ncbi:hypothetical protein TRFO_38855 [Tritrichomonas foetus]|uniref:Uncharacterized protein n=1 Tax=Tritrichomonas foetus TaxID=1144522 RepID=A0A1J4J6V2_9EUKA|nr:hypothetical protein TRFO_38855 [Tritrichomonas foetus]|eukprot:OHS94966.1 hypothetical protein TRFO_38855 [Tritrichomonas foetus]
MKSKTDKISQHLILKPYEAPKELHISEESQSQIDNIILTLENNPEQLQTENEEIKEMNEKLLKTIPSDEDFQKMKENHLIIKEKTQNIKKFIDEKNSLKNQAERYDKVLKFFAFKTEEMMCAVYQNHDFEGIAQEFIDSLINGDDQAFMQLSEKVQHCH